MKKVFGQTVRDLKREVNKKVLKVPGIEQKVLDATSNEPWGPHGSNLADIALATRNYHEYQLIMNVIWKRINDTGKNWRHVYKALTVLEYLVANGSERVIDEIREHAYQLSTLSDFQYIDSSGRDQGSNVRRKSLSLVSLVNDKERVLEVRQKALNNKDKYRSNRPGGYGDRYDDDRYGNREDDRNGYGKERDWGSRDDDRYGRSKDPYSRDGDRYGRDLDDRCVRDSYRDGDYRGRGNDDYQYGSRNRRSTDRDTERSHEDDDRYSSRGSRADGFPQDERRQEYKIPDSIGAPPSYEEALKDAQNHIQDEKDGGSVAASPQNESSPVVPKVSSPAGSSGQGPDHVVEGVPVAASTKEVDPFDEFDPRSTPAVPQAAFPPDMDFFGSLAVSDANSLALMPVASDAPSEPDSSINSGYGTDFVALSTASTVMSQPGENPFGDPPFKATPPENFSAQPQSSEPTILQPPSMVGGAEPFPAVAQATETVPNFDFGDALGGLTYTPTSVPNGPQSSANVASQPLWFPEAQATNDILDALLPPTGVPTMASSLPAQPVGMTHMQTPHMNIPPQTEVSASLAPQSVQFPSYVSQPAAPSSIQTAPLGHALQSSALAANDPLAALTTGLPTVKSQPSIDKFEPKSTVWADTLSRGLVNLNISGPKINPLADIGIDFESINRKEKREAKSSAAPVTTSTITMGKAMGTGSGIGRAGASGLAPPPNHMAGFWNWHGHGTWWSGQGMGIGGSYGSAMNQPMNQAMGMGGMNMNMNMGMGMGMNMGMAPGAPMRPPMGMPPNHPQGPGMPGAGYNPMIGTRSL
ncbi:clathrin interactor EPSIN 2-like isoform X3 [Dioscorea cayenensis subsp. rotundata]|uniref:Clathrin interactor EPSIN 2-like isoform X3 n=1 Tax=Dioscorea cayennensis subsp. rotundata TaxID=55577 RepID=A0AB40CI77_DIOCR|nr:clathrin interactor EPSIN 2-like isoform X3 [Dioscorea cayenensis subsp. rotundata]